MKVRKSIFRLVFGKKHPTHDGRKDVKDVSPRMLKSAQRE